MLLDQIDELTAPIGTVTELLDAAIAALPAEPATGPAGPLVPPPATDAAAPARFAATVQRPAKIPGAGPDSVRAVIGEIGGPNPTASTSTRTKTTSVTRGSGSGRRRMCPAHRHLRRSRARRPFGPDRRLRHSRRGVRRAAASRGRRPSRRRRPCRRVDAGRPRAHVASQTGTRLPVAGGTAVCTSRSSVCPSKSTSRPANRRGSSRCGKWPALGKIRSTRRCHQQP